MNATNSLAPTRKFGLSADALKLIAIIAMVVDHAAGAFIPMYYSTWGIILHCIGRITGPIMFYFIAEGYHRTRNANRYTLRLAIFALVSYLPFIYLRTGALPTSQNFYSLNVIYTLLLGLLAVRARHEIQNAALRILALAAILFFSQIGDWGYLAIVFILLFDVFRGNFKFQAAAYTAVALTQILPYFFDVFRNVVLEQQSFAIYQQRFGYSVVMCGLFLPLGLLALYNGQKGGLGRAGKWLFYIFYPAHMLLIGWLHFGL